MGEAPPDVQIEDKSLGELIALLSANASRLVKSEIELAKLELKGDAKRAMLSGVLFGAAAAFVCVALIPLTMFAAYGLMTLGVWDWLAFLIVFAALVVLAVVLCVIGVLQLRKRKMSGLRATRRTVTGDLAMLRRGSGEPPAISE
jgi:uncharacterized membrane protein YqjE